jgi:hypothetical protein
MVPCYSPKNCNSKPQTSNSENNQMPSILTDTAKKNLKLNLEYSKVEYKVHCTIENKCIILIHLQKHMQDLMRLYYVNTSLFSISIGFVMQV